MFIWNCSCLNRYKISLQVWTVTQTSKHSHLWIKEVTLNTGLNIAVIYLQYIRFCCFVDNTSKPCKTKGMLNTERMLLFYRCGSTYFKIHQSIMQHRKFISSVYKSQYNYGEEVYLGHCGKCFVIEYVQNKTIQSHLDPTYCVVPNFSKLRIYRSISGSFSLILTIFCLRSSTNIGFFEYSA